MCYLVSDWFEDVGICLFEMVHKHTYAPRRPAWPARLVPLGTYRQRWRLVLNNSPPISHSCIDSPKGRGCKWETRHRKSAHARASWVSWTRSPRTRQRWSRMKKWLMMHLEWSNHDCLLGFWARWRAVAGVGRLAVGVQIGEEIWKMFCLSFRYQSRFVSLPHHMGHFI